VGYDISADLAIVKIERTGLTAVELGNSDTLQVGDITIALGNPGGLQYLGSVSQGIISGLNRSIQSESAYENLTLIQTDAAINPGNSGGALVDVSGKLIGINSAKLVAEEYEGMGFAIPVNDVIAICSEIVKNGFQKSPYLGVEINSNYTAENLERLGYPGGILVDSIASGSPAESAGMKVEDIIVSFNGTTIRTASDLREAKNAAKSGDTVIIRAYRLTQRTYFGRWEGEYIDFSVTLG
jgi:serine protease Do